MHAPLNSSSLPINSESLIHIADPSITGSDVMRLRHRRLGRNEVVDAFDQPSQDVSSDDRAVLALRPHKEFIIELMGERRRFLVFLGHKPRVARAPRAGASPRVPALKKRLRVLPQGGRRKVTCGSC